MSQFLTLALAGHPRTARFWHLTLALMVVLVTWLALTSAPPELPVAQWDKLHHAAGFAGLAAVAWFGFSGAWLRIAGSLLLFGGLIEWLQTFTATRAAEWGDLAADAVGITIGLVVASLLTHAATARVASLEARRR